MSEKLKSEDRSLSKKSEEERMETAQRHLEDDERGTPAGVRSCQKWHLTFSGAALGIIALVVGLVLKCTLSGDLTSTQITAPEEGQTLSTDMDKLQQCQREQADLKLMLHSATQDSRCRLCPHTWLWWKSHCYFFSNGLQGNRQWNESADFCRQHNSSLLVIKDSTEMDFIQGVMSTFPRFPFLWVGLTDVQQEGRWLWEDGTDVQLIVEWDTDDRDCADLRGGGSVVAAECDVYGPWACKRES